MNDTNDGIAMRIKSIRELYGLSQLEFAKRLDITLPIVTAFESGLIVFDNRTISRICDEFDVIENWLLTGQINPCIKIKED
jgi:transcriptional regulator with XRE-family HTH domain